MKHQFMVDDRVDGKIIDWRLFTRMVSYLGPYKKWVAVGFIFIIVLTAIELALPYLIKLATDDYIVSDKTMLFVPAGEVPAFKAVHKHDGLKYSENQAGSFVVVPLAKRRMLSQDEQNRYEYSLFMASPARVNAAVTTARYSGQVFSDDNMYLFPLTGYQKSFIAPDTLQSWQTAGLLIPAKIMLTYNDAEMHNLLGRLPVYTLDNERLAVPVHLFEAGPGKTDQGNRILAGKRARHYLFIIGIITLALSFLRFVLNYIQLYILTYFSQNAMFDLRRDIFKHLTRMSLSFFDRNPVGRLTTRATNDIGALNEMLNAGLLALVQDVFVLIGIIIMMLTMDWRMALISFTIMPPIYLLVMYFKGKTRVAYRAVRQRLAEINSKLSEDISGMKIIQLFNRYDYKNRTFDETNEEYYQATIRQMHLFSMFQPVISNSRYIVIALILWYGGGQILHNAMSLGLFLAFIKYIERFFEPINSLSDKFNILQGAMAGAERIFDLLDKDEEVYLPRHTKLPRAKGAIKFEDVHMAYIEDELVLKGINLNITPGEKVALVGHTGSGKTSIVNLLAGMYPYQKGRILLDDGLINDMPKQDLRRHVGMVQQDVFLFAGTLRENIALGDPSITDEQLDRIMEQVCLTDFINSLPGRYDEPVMEKGATFSVGQRQLIAFARVLAYNPAVFVLDEATANIDTETEGHIQRALESVTMGRTSIIIAHRLSTIQHADRIIVLHKGHIAEEGSHQELLAKQGLYYDLYRLQYEKRGVAIN